MCHNHASLDAVLAVLVTAAAMPFIGPWHDEAMAAPLIAHRGASHDAPENTPAAFRLAFERGADGIEADFHCSADGHLVCIHDARTKRVARTDLAVAESPLDRLAQLDVGSWKGDRFADQRIVTLPEVLALLPEGKRFLIEVKSGPEGVPQLQRDIRASEVSLEQLTVIAFDSRVIAATRHALPEIKALWLTGWKETDKPGRFTPSIATVLETLRRIDATGLDAQANPDVLTPAVVRRLREAGFEVHCWTVNQPELARRMIEAGVQSITTDRPGWLRRKLQAQ